jgi:O-antigen/teichoic acid export membrane protein
MTHFLRPIAAMMHKLTTPIGRRLLDGGVWTLAGETGTRALTFFASVVVARVLGLSEFGQFALVQSTLMTFMTFAAFGMGQTSSRYIAASRNANPRRISQLSSLTLGLSIITGLAAAVFLLLMAPTLSKNYLAMPTLAGPLRIAAPALLCYAVTGAVTGIITGFEGFRRLAMVTWVGSFANFAAIVVGAFFFGLTGAVAGLLASELIRGVLITRLAHIIMRENGLSLIESSGFSEIGLLWRFSLPSLLSGMLHVPVFWLCQLLVAGEPNGMEQLGLYDAAQKCMTLVTFVPGAASGAVGPVLASLSGSGQASSHRRLTLTIAAIQAATCAGPAFVVMLVAPLAMGVFGAEFVTGAAATVTLMFAAPIVVVVRLLWQALLSIERAWTSFFLWLLWAFTALFLTWMWRGEGANGLAHAMLFSYALIAIGYLAVLLKAWSSQEGCPPISFRWDWKLELKGSKIAGK